MIALSERGPHGSQPCFRFAPSPNGLLHLGHALSAVLNFRAATALGGRFLLRIEDIDTVRSREAHVTAILDDLAWLGLAWEKPVRRQSAYFPFYAEALGGLRDRGLVYPCFCTRGAIKQYHAERTGGGPIRQDPDGAPLYQGTCRSIGSHERDLRIANGEPHAWRLDMARALATLPHGAAPLSWQEAAIPEGGDNRHEPARPELWGDVVLARRDAPASYHLCVVLDDAAQGVSHVVRGLDLFHATGLHRLIQRLLDLPAPLYHHHRLILDDEGRKLSKSRHSTSLQAIRNSGGTAESVLAMIGIQT
jgi:glutamyl-Q tRNA(Asp) synthetase